jgi:ParB family chromosome partitioning protein
MASKQFVSNLPSEGIITELLVSKIYHSSNPLRDVNASIQELQDSIVERGLLHPIIVRALGDKFEIVAGNRRFTACKQLGWKRITCHVLELDDKDAFEVSLVENLQHKTLNAVEEAVAYKKYVDEFGWGGVSELARKIGKSHSYISNRMRLLELSPSVLEKIVRRQTTPAVMQEVLAVKDKEKRRALADEIINNDLNREQVRKILRQPDPAMEYLSNSCLVSKKEQEIHEKEKAIMRFITSLRIALLRLDDTLEAVDKEDWILWMLLMHFRTELHRNIDELIVLGKKTRSNYDRLWRSQD